MTTKDPNGKDVIVTAQALRGEAAGFIGVCDNLGYVYCASCWSEAGKQTPKADELSYPLPIYFPAGSCETCKEEIA